MAITDITIVNGHEFDPTDMKTTMLVVFGLPNELIRRFIGGSLNDIKKLKSRLQILLDAKTSPIMSYKAQGFGFKLEGCFNGAMIFTEKELVRLRKIAPWVKITLSQFAIILSVFSSEL